MTVVLGDWSVDVGKRSRKRQTETDRQAETDTDREIQREIKTQTDCLSLN
jgi:hypothetical protein